jgi:hypothetical protein
MMARVPTAIVSDLHLGAGTGSDLLRRPRFRELLWRGLDGADTVVLLGDVIELRDRPLAEAIAIAGPFFDELGEFLGDGRIVLVPGNHDHHLIEPWLERRRLDHADPLALEQRELPLEGAAGALAARLSSATLELAYPGLWVADGVYAIHGHYLDRHLTVPTFERLGVAAVERILGVQPDELGTGDPDTAGPDDYERAQAPVYAFLYTLAQAGPRADAGGPSARVWAAVGAGDTPTARLRGWLLGTVAVPGAVGIANRLGLGPVSPDLSGEAIASAGIAAIAEVVRRLGIDAEHLVFGHTHRRGPLPRDDGWSRNGVRLTNTGSWVHSPSLIGRDAASSPWWPGTVAVVDGAAPPRLINLLDALSREELAER